MGGILGTILLGVFATTAVNSAGADGLLMGNGLFFVKQTVIVVLVGAYAFLFSLLALKVINLFTKVKVTDQEEADGLDISLHGEVAYEEGVLG